MTRPSREAMLTGPVLPILLRLGLPTIAVLIAQIMVQIIETYWASRLGTAALAGVTLVVPVLALMGTMSNGGIGGGVSSAIARALGAGNRAEADALIWHALVLAGAFGAAFTAIGLLAGPSLYAALGGQNESLAAALLYSNWVFAGALPFWAMNLLAAGLRGAGEVRLPARVTLFGAAILLPVSPALIFGVGPLPGMGLAGAGLAVNIYYLGGLAAFWRHLRGGGALTLRPVPLSAARFGAILRVGLISALGTVIASLTVVLVTGAVGREGATALAGYGAASRIDTLLVPLLFGFGSAVITLVGLAAGAGDDRRASAVVRTGVVAAAIGTEAIGIIAALFAETWMGIFTSDPEVIAAGAAYLRIAAPFYGAVGVTLTLYFACQGLGRMAWPLAGGVGRLVLSSAGAWALVGAGWGMTGVGLAVVLGSIVAALISAVGLSRRSGFRGVLAR